MTFFCSRLFRGDRKEAQIPDSMRLVEEKAENGLIESHKFCQRKLKKGVRRPAGKTREFKKKWDRDEQFKSW